MKNTSFFARVFDNIRRLYMKNNHITDFINFNKEKILNSRLLEMLFVILR